MTAPSRRQPVSAENRQLARHAATAFGGKPAVREFVHDTLPLVVDILSCTDAPAPGFVSYSTIGVSDVAMVDARGEFPARVEFAAIAPASAEGFHKVLGSAAFRVMRSQEVVRPGRVFVDYVAEYFPDTALPHLYFTAPFHWEAELSAATFGAKRVNWLLAFPISAGELAYVREHGDEAFEALLERADADVALLDRPPVA